MNIGVFFGSRNTEHDISIITGQMVVSGLRGLSHNVIPIYITKKGYWMFGEELGRLNTFTDQSKKIENNEKLTQYVIDLEESHGKIVFRKKGLAGKKVVIDLAFPALHGSYGEDGTIQGLFEMLDIPYIGCGLAASALAMDKAFAKQICQANNIPTTKFVTFGKSDWQEDKGKIIASIKNDLKWPVFVKPVHLGSSIGIAKVKDPSGADLENKIDVALYYDDKVLVEEAVLDLMDVTCCVIGNEKLQASELQESVFETDLFDFEEKYLKDGGSQLGKSESGLIIPARLDSSVTEKIKEVAKQVYRALGCTGIARVDFLYNKATKEYFANEINPLPGTLYHHLWKETGKELGQLLIELIEFAIERHKRISSLNHSFDSTVLSSLNSSKLGSKKIVKN